MVEETSLPGPTEEQKLKTAKREILFALLDRYPHDMSTAPSGQLAKLRQEEPYFDRAIKELGQLRLIELEENAGQFTAKIRGAGVEELSDIAGGTTYDLLERIPGAMLKGMAASVKALEVAEMKRDHLERQVGAFEAKLAEIERQFYGRIITIVAMFVSVFALVMAITQRALTITETDPVKVFWISSAMIAPIGFVVVVIVVGAWVSGRLR